jgi:hypothetical protein
MTDDLTHREIVEAFYAIPAQYRDQATWFMAKRQFDLWQRLDRMPRPVAALYFAWRSLRWWLRAVTR